MKLLPKTRPLYRPDGTLDMREIGIQNDEPKVMTDIIRVVTAAPPGPPALVLFFSDGGIYRDARIEQILRDAAPQPIFWQFVGLGNSTTEYSSAWTRCRAGSSTMPVSSPWMISTGLATRSYTSGY